MEYYSALKRNAIVTCYDMDESFFPLGLCLFFHIFLNYGASTVVSIFHTDESRRKSCKKDKADTDRQRPRDSLQAGPRTGKFTDAERTGEATRRSGGDWGSPSVEGTEVQFGNDESCRRQCWWLLDTANVLNATEMRL